MARYREMYKQRQVELAKNDPEKPPAAPQDSGDKLRLDFRIPTALHRKLKSRSEELDLTQTEIVVRALRAYLKDSCPTCGGLR